MMTRMDLWDTITSERLALADTLDTLNPEQWRTSSLCGAWTVRGVVSHLLSGVVGGLGDFFPAFIRARGNFDRASELTAERSAGRPTADLVAELRTHATSRFEPPLLGAAAPLTEILVHRQDIAIPLGLRDDRPVEPWGDVLDFLIARKARIGFVAGRLPALRYVATDLDWERGAGPVVEGPAAGLALSMLGRPAGLDRLGGAGVDRLRTWVVG